MNTPFAASVHKENVHIGGGKATVRTKPEMLKPAKTAGKERKALADLKSMKEPSGGMSKEVDLKPKSAMHGNQVKRIPMEQGKEAKAVPNLCPTKEPLLSGVSKGASLNNKSVLQGKIPMENLLADEEINLCYEWAKDGIEEMEGYLWSVKDELNLSKNRSLSDIMASATGVPISKLESPFMSDEEGYETDGVPDLRASPSFPGCLSSVHTPEELYDPLGVAGIVLDEYPLPELELKEDYEDVDINSGIDGHPEAGRIGDGGSHDGGFSQLSPLGMGRKKLPATSLLSPSNPLIKHCVKLRLSSSYRRACGSAIVIGLMPITEICRFQELKGGEPSIVECLLLPDGTERSEIFNFSSTSVVHVSHHVMKKISGVKSVESLEAIAIMKIPKSFCEMPMEYKDVVYPSWFPFPSRLIVLDGIQDPGNLGTLLRSAMAFKWDLVFLLPGCCDPFNEKAIRASRGVSFQIHIITGNWLHLESLTDRFQMKMLAGHPENYDKASRQVSLLSRELVDSFTSRPLCLVLGSEGHGLSQQALQSCELVSIPMAGMFESLNVSVAGGIFLYMLQPGNHR
ncbi:hypothetical protein AXF42_Ash016792 [Apostasia shenzhenica]|uniref:tRNA/rRNA methyltransferase SpoU type domain-containing protein n=1 Tax=Apostasia shenzhenica TaxID=1088818 RepID=A0A2I0BAG8_9ASPA|nr:hypothetical protein AXF42_Ash016792 [Apostasia shenzhenica]